MKPLKKSPYCYSPLTSKHLGMRITLADRIRRRIKRPKGIPLTVVWYRSPILPSGYRGRLE